ncbi:type II toxin-antitoxin system VapC family toxin [Micromonospora sp. NBC_01796]|uniref:type II toxin-antitoxin system VapC family toxin n=1 Tax=Micromonospora sp. NBC_01796 TaxID=2975987 RepID=UPI002DDBF841|nr:type II toxin-antitoxin system VapC family toxin [Micromonospora sp. NBC_01796]WSA88433.1 type II toxin-antitoxin system VapC family toxin [Micromonospora sp. NBC_01796]
MRLLLDTHVVIWWLTDDPTLAEEIKAQLDHEPDVYVSPVTVWEVCIKQAIGKLKEPADLPERIRASGFRELPVTSEHAIAAGRLPLFHRDPFDRMLVAQARCEDLTLITRDPEIRKYDVSVLAA